MRKSALCGLALIGTAAAAWTGCDASKTTELVAGVSTQVQVPRDIKSILIDVNVGGANVFCMAYTVYDGHVQLPRTLGTLPAREAGTPVTIKVSAFQVDADSSDVMVLSNCSLAPTVGGDPMTGGGAKVLRVSRQPYSQDAILFVPMPLKYSCFDLDCGSSDDMTCKAGQCVGSDTDVSKLVPYDDAVLFGKDSTCFAVFGDNGCFADIATVPPLTVDDATCTYAIPGAVGGPPLPAGITAPQVPSGVTLPPDGLNVRITYDSGITNEILDLDKDEGFIVPNPSTPQIFKLVDGLCQMVHGTGPSTHRITGIQVSPICRPKLSSQSICAADALAIVGANPDGTAMSPTGTCSTAALVPVQSAVEFVVDPTANAQDFYSAASALIPKLSDPGLKNLLLGVQFIPDGPAACPTASTLASFDKTATSTSALASYISSLTGAASSVSANHNADLNVTAALEAAYADLGAGTAANAVNKSVIVVASTGLSQSCPTAGGQTPAQVIAAANGISTSVIEVGATPQGACSNAALQSAVGGSSNCLTTTGSHAQEAILKELTAAAACTYQQPATVPDAVWFSDPAIPGSTIVSVKSMATTAAQCRAAGTGYFTDGKSLIFCKDTCGAYQTALTDAAALLAAAAAATDGGSSSSTTSQLPTIIPVFAMTGNACIAPQPTMPMSSDGGTSSDGGSLGDGGTSSNDASASGDSGSQACTAAGRPPAANCNDTGTDNQGATWTCGATTYAIGCVWDNTELNAPLSCVCVKNGSTTTTVIPMVDYPVTGTCSSSAPLPTSTYDTPKLLADCGFVAPHSP